LKGCPEKARIIIQQNTFDSKLSFGNRASKSAKKPMDTPAPAFCFSFARTAELVAQKAKMGYDETVFFI
jgi:hypothetical protein